MSTPKVRNTGVRDLSRETGYSPGIVHRKLTQGKSPDEIRADAAAYREKQGLKPLEPGEPRLERAPVDRPKRVKRDESFYDAQKRKESAVADIREMEAQQKAGELVDVTVVEAQWTEIATAIRDSLLGLPLKISGKLAGLQDQREIERYLKTSFRAELAKISKTLDESQSAAA